MSFFWEVICFVKSSCEADNAAESLRSCSISLRNASIYAFWAEFSLANAFCVLARLFDRVSRFFSLLSKCSSTCFVCSMMLSLFPRLPLVIVTFRFWFYPFDLSMPSWFFRSLWTPLRCDSSALLASRSPLSLFIAVFDTEPSCLSSLVALSI